MSKFSDFLSGKKNYIFAIAMIAAGVIVHFAPDLHLSILGLDEPGELISAGIAWALGRDAISKAGAQ